MPLERHELESIQCDCAADDIEIPDAARAWSEEEAYAFFESGGTAWPNPQGLEATELLAYYEARKPATENHSASALLAALGKSLGMEDALAAEAAPAPPTDHWKDWTASDGDELTQFVHWTMTELTDQF